MNLFFLQDTVSRLNNLNVYIESDIETQIAHLTEEDLRQLSHSYNEIVSKGLADTLVWQLDAKRESDRFHAGVACLLRLFHHLGVRGYLPFASGEVRCFTDPVIDGRDEVPTELRFLMPAAVKFGAIFGDVAAFEFLSHCSEADHDQLESIKREIDRQSSLTPHFWEIFWSFASHDNCSKYILAQNIANLYYLLQYKFLFDESA